MLTKKDILTILHKAEKAHMAHKNHLKDCSKSMYDFVRNQDEINEHIKSECVKTFFANETRVDLCFKFIAEEVPVMNISTEDKLKLIATNLCKYLDECGFVQYDDGWGKQKKDIEVYIGQFFEQTMFRKAYYQVECFVWFHG